MSEENKNHQNIEKNKKSNKGLIITGLIIAIIIVALITNGFGLLNKKVPTANSLSIGKAPVLGNVNAPITIYEFSDFSCPYCAAADGNNGAVINSLRSSDPTWQAPLPSIIQNYVNTGKAKLVFKYTPGHGAGVAAQLVGWGLNDQELFWKFHEAAFADQPNVGDINKMLTLAQTIGANMTQLNEAINSKKYNSLLDEDAAMGKRNGVTGTPTFFINGNIIEGACTYSTFQKALDAELSGKKWYVNNKCQTIV